MRKRLLLGGAAAILLAAIGLSGLAIRYPVRYMQAVHRYAGKLTPALVCAVIHAESKFRSDARSGEGAVGLMQVTDRTAEWIAGMMGMDGYEPALLADPDINIALGCYYLNWLYGYYNGDVELTVCAYNAGQGNVNRWLADTEFSPDGKTLATIPFGETRVYLRRVEFNRIVYQALLFFSGEGV